MKADDWVKQFYKPVTSEGISMPDHTDPTCVLIDNKWYELSRSDYNYYIDLRIKDNENENKNK